LRAGCFYFIN